MIITERMATEIDYYHVRPRKPRNGWNLESGRLSHGALWYKSESDALSYAKWNSRVNGCRIEILDEQNRVLRTEEFSSGDFCLLNKKRANP
jgi:hypothetical protein